MTWRLTLSLSLYDYHWLSLSISQLSRLASRVYHSCYGSSIALLSLTGAPRILGIPDSQKKSGSVSRNARRGPGKRVTWVTATWRNVSVCVHGQGNMWHEHCYLYIYIYTLYVYLNVYIYIYVYMYVYIYIYICVCVCVHIYIYIYMYVYIYIYICVCVCVHINALKPAKSD